METYQSQATEARATERFTYPNDLVIYAALTRDRTQGFLHTGDFLLDRREAPAIPVLKVKQ